MKMIQIASAALLLVCGLGSARAGDDARPREPVTVSVSIQVANGSGIPIITVPAGKRFVGQAVTCYAFGRAVGAQCVLQANLKDGSLIEMPLPPIPDVGDNVTHYPTVTQVAPFYLGPGSQLVGYCFNTAPMQITVSGYFVKDKD